MLPKSRFSKAIFGHSAGSTKLDRPHCKQFRTSIGKTPNIYSHLLGGCKFVFLFPSCSFLLPFAALFFSLALCCYTSQSQKIAHQLRCVAYICVCVHPNDFFFPSRFSPSLIHGLCAFFASNSRFMRLFQAALDTPLDSPFSATLSVHGLHFTVCAPSKFCPSWSVSGGSLLASFAVLGGGWCGVGETEFCTGKAYH